MKNARLLLLLPSLVVILFCVAFPPRRWTDRESSEYRPSRGRIFKEDSTARDWISSHMYRERPVARDYRRLAYECGIAAAAGVGLYLFYSSFEKRLETPVA